MSTVEPYNPLDKKNLGQSVTDALLRSETHPLGGVPTTHGAGIYAIYYTGTFEPYERIAEQNRDGKFAMPIYVGKAVPEGARKGGIRTNSSKQNADLCKRLREHAASISATDLNINDFYCRLLVVDDIWIPLGESLLIAQYAPLWNRTLDGFGNHNPGKGRRDGMRSRWDVLHPGRPWAEVLQPRAETREQMIEEIRNYVQNIPRAIRPESPNASPLIPPSA
jgi:hypothetical protein